MTRSHLAHFLRDAGYRSRKFAMTVGVMLLIFTGGVMAGVWTLFGSHYETMISGLLGALTIYCGANAAGRWGTAKHLGSKIAEAEAGPPPEASPEPQQDPPPRKR